MKKYFFKLWLLLNKKVAVSFLSYCNEYHYKRIRKATAQMPDLKYYLVIDKNGKNAFDPVFTENEIIKKGEYHKYLSKEELFDYWINTEIINK